MRITQWGEYGVHCSAFIAHHELQHGHRVLPVGATEIAAAQNIALDYTQQILQRLRRGQVIESVRGPNGGYHLARPASEITLLDVLVATEGDSFQVICDSKPIDSTRCASDKACGLRPVWVELRDQLNIFLTKFNLADLTERLYGADAERCQSSAVDHLVKLGRPAE